MTPVNSGIFYYEGNMVSYKGVQIGGVYPTRSFGSIEVLSIESSVKAQVRFIDSGYETQAELGQIRRGTVKDWTESMSQKIGCIYPTVTYGDVEILEYVDGFNVKVRFLNTGFEGWYPAGNIKLGKIMDYIAPSMAGVGYIGVGPHSSGNQKKAYKHWAHMLQRCYIETEEFKNYHDKTVKAEWHNFQNFTNWCLAQVGFHKEGWQLDKDILSQGNKEYGPDTCCFVPARINSLVIKSDSSGKKVDKRGWIYFTLRDEEGNRTSNKFMDREEGRTWYKTEREKIIKAVADQYKNVLDSRVYEALYFWQVN